MSANPERAQRGWPSVIVAGAYQTAIVLMRNLSRRGLEVCCIDSNPKMPGFKTIYGKAYQCPDADGQPEQWAGFMVELAKKIGGKPVLIPSSDRFITAVGDHTELLEQYYVFPRASIAVQALLATKQRQYDIAAKHGLGVPRTAFVTSREELLDFADASRFPCLLKPVHFREWQRFPPSHPLYFQKVAVAGSREQLEGLYQTAATLTPEVVVQEVIQGPDTAKLVYLSCYAHTGERIGTAMVRQLRTAPIRFGSASIVEQVSDPDADAACDAFLRGICYVGLCEIELKRDVRDGSLKMIEANPRYSVTADVGYYLGVDLGWLHYLDLIGQHVEPVQPQPRPDFRHIVLLRDFESYRSYLREGLVSWRELIRSYRPPVAFFDFDWRDWRVTGANVWAMFKLLAGPTLKRLLGRR